MTAICICLTGRRCVCDTILSVDVMEESEKNTNKKHMDMLVMEHLLARAKSCQLPLLLVSGFSCPSMDNIVILTLALTVINPKSLLDNFTG